METNQINKYALDFNKYTFELPKNTIHITQYKGEPIDLYYTPDDGHFYRIINGKFIKKILHKPLDSTLYKRLNINTTDGKYFLNISYNRRQFHIHLTTLFKELSTAQQGTEFLSENEAANE